MKPWRSWRSFFLLQAAVLLLLEWPPRVVTGDLASLLFEGFVAGVSILGIVLIVRGLVNPAPSLTSAVTALGKMILVAVGAFVFWLIILTVFPLFIWKPVERSVLELFFLPPLVAFSTGTMIHMRLGPFRTYLPPMERVRQILAENPGAYLGGAATENRIAEAERILGLTLPKSYREFLASWGDLEFRMRKYLGIPATMDMDHPTPADFVGTTLEAREQAGLPSQLVVCATRPDGPRACLNTFAMRDREAPVVLWDSASRTIVRTLAPTFAGFLRDRLEAVLKSSGNAFVQQNQHEAW